MPTVRTPDRCSCRCECFDDRIEGGNDLCARCWKAWCAPLSTKKVHAPVADRSYLGAYGVTGLWTGWIANQGAGHLLARPFHKLLETIPPPPCPAAAEDDPHHMLRRPGGWKCYRHDDPVVVMDKYDIPPAPSHRPIKARKRKRITA